MPPDDSACSWGAFDLDSEFWVWEKPFPGKQQSELISDCGVWDETGGETVVTERGIQKTGPSVREELMGSPATGSPSYRTRGAGQVTANGSDHGMQGSEWSETSKLA